MPNTQYARKKTDNKFELLAKFRQIWSHCVGSSLAVLDNTHLGTYFVNTLTISITNNSTLTGYDTIAGNSNL